MGDWQKLSSKIVYDNRWITVYEDETLNPAGQKTIYGHVLSKCPAVYIVALDDEGNTYLTKQQRYVTGTTAWECPAGRTEKDSVIVAAKRELLEETGVKAESIEIMGKAEVASGVAMFPTYFCLARGITQTSNKLDQIDGILDAKKLPLNEVYDMILRGEIVCSQSIAAFFMAGKYIENKAKEQ